MCHCGPRQPCHADVLIRVFSELKANAITALAAPPVADEQALRTGLLLCRNPGWGEQPWSVSARRAGLVLGTPSESAMATLNVCSSALGLAVAGLPGPAGRSICNVEGGAAFWTAHSDRATLPSWAASVATIPDAWLEDSGRWSSRSSHGYA